MVAGEVSGAKRKELNGMSDNARDRFAAAVKRKEKGTPGNNEEVGICIQDIATHQFNNFETNRSATRLARRSWNRLTSLRSC
jgi:hypothetical protein